MHSAPFKNFFTRDHSKKITFWTIQKIYNIGLNFILGAIAKVFSPEPFQNYHILDYSYFFFLFFLDSSRIFMFFYSFQELYVLDPSRISIFLTIQDLLHSFQNFYILDDYRPFIFWTVQTILCSGSTQILNFISGPFLNFCLLDHSRNSSNIRWCLEGVI